MNFVGGEIDMRLSDDYVVRTLLNVTIARSCVRRIFR